MREFYTIYSEPSLDAVKKLITTFLELCGICDLTPDDMFYFGVFCHVTTYANFPNWEDAIAEGIEVPEILLSDCNTSQERIDYVNQIIEDVMTGKIEKPEWMKYVEENAVCDWCDQMPSTYLYIIAKEERFKELACRLLMFLYSPNGLSSIVDC